MNFSEFFEPINLNLGDLNHNYLNNSFVNAISLYNGQDLKEFNVALIGVGEERGSSSNSGISQAPNHVRKYLYKLNKLVGTSKIIDFGNLKIGASLNDTYFALSSILEELIKLEIIPIIIGGGQDLTYSNFLAYKNLEQTVNLVAIDSNFDLG